MNPTEAVIGAVILFAMCAVCHAFCVSANPPPGASDAAAAALRDTMLSTTLGEWRGALSKFALEKAGLYESSSRSAKRTQSIFQSKGETLVRSVLERDMFPGRKFPNVRPAWLKNPKTNRSLEIDCYNKKMKLGVEVHGKQHYKYNPAIHKTKEAFQKSQERDALKRTTCARNGVVLIEMPYSHTSSRESIRRFITSALRDQTP